MELKFSFNLTLIWFFYFSDLVHILLITIFFNHSFNLIIFLIASFNILYHSLHWIIFSIASLNILFYFMLNLVLILLIAFCFVFNPSLLEISFLNLSLNILLIKILLIQNLTSWFFRVCLQLDDFGLGIQVTGLKD
jgi:hypothetical protein